MSSRIVIALLIVAAWISIPSCSFDSPTDQTSATDLVTEGWKAYSARDYSTAASKFDAAITKDASLVDAYNGSGWSNAKLDNLDLALTNFSIGLSKDSTNLDILAGLAYVDNARKDYASSDASALEVLDTNPEWSFRADTTITGLDLRLLLAGNYFAEGSYALSLAQVHVLDPAFAPGLDVSTVAGQTVLAQEIELLHSRI